MEQGNEQKVYCKANTHDFAIYHAQNVFKKDKLVVY